MRDIINGAPKPTRHMLKGEISVKTATWVPHTASQMEPRPAELDAQGDDAGRFPSRLARYAV